VARESEAQRPSVKGSKRGFFKGRSKKSFFKKAITGRSELFQASSNSLNTLPLRVKKGSTQVRLDEERRKGRLE